MGQITQLGLDLRQQPLHFGATAARFRRQRDSDVSDGDMHQRKQLAGLIVEHLRDAPQLAFQHLVQVP